MRKLYTFILHFCSFQYCFDENCRNAFGTPDSDYLVDHSPSPILPVFSHRYISVANYNVETCKIVIATLEIR